MASEIKMQLPDDLIKAHIRLAVIEALDKSGGNEKLIEAVVKAAMEEKEKNSYSSYGEKTVFGQQVREMIRDEAKAVFQQWLDENKQNIHDAFMKRLKKSPQKFIDHIVETFLGAMASDFSFQVKWEPKDRDTF